MDNIYIFENYISTLMIKLFGKYIMIVKRTLQCINKMRGNILIEKVMILFIYFAILNVQSNPWSNEDRKHVNEFSKFHLYNSIEEYRNSFE